ncbi:MAG: hypothetical protein PHX34_05235, partial [Candidatus Shapirobacteria bacterium]|nr:hypothetical protein [Candidatus Shapirobacteria bacterium]
MKYCIYAVLLFVILSLGLCKVVYAGQLFVDNFESLENWNFTSSDSNDLVSWSVDKNQLIGNVSQEVDSFLISNENIFFDFDFVFEANNLSGVDQEILFRVADDYSSYYVLNIRFPDPFWVRPNDPLNRIILWKFQNGNFSKLSEVVLSELNLELLQNHFYQFLIRVNNGTISFSLDDNLMLNYEDSDFLTGGRIGFWNHGGSYYYSNTHNVFYNLVVCDYNSFPGCDITVTPTPAPKLKKKIFILPGLGASWNSNAIVYNQSVSDNQWEMTPFVKNYDALVELLEKNGLKKDEDFFMWNYDWRRPVSEIENNFNFYLEGRNIGQDDEIYLIGHSLGGLVARLWQQDHNDPRIKGILTLGSPELGSVDSYGVWNGGKLFRKSNNWGSIAMKILLIIKSEGLVPDLDKIRSFVPVVKDLLPTFNYVYKDGKLLTGLETINSYLREKNSFVSGVFDNLSSSVGVGFSTPNKVNLNNRSVFDKALNLWPDGGFISLGFEDGDRTVLKNSAGFGSNDIFEINSDHENIVNNSLSWIIEKVGLTQVDVSVESD